MPHYSRYKKPPNAVPSPFLLNAMKKLDLDRGLPILDLACGYGRHSTYFARQGYHVIAADFDADVFRDGWYKTYQCIYPVLLDADKVLSFAPMTFSAILVVHFYHRNLLQSLYKYLAPGGYLIYESINGHGNNWIELDIRGRVKKIIKEDLNIILYKENAVGPAKQYATVKMIAQMHNKTIA